MTNETALTIATAAATAWVDAHESVSLDCWDESELAAAMLDALHDHYMDDDETASYLAAVIESDREIDRARIEAEITAMPGAVTRHAGVSRDRVLDIVKRGD